MAVHEAKKIKSIPVEIKRVGTWDEPFYIVEWGKPVKWIVFGIFFKTVEWLPGMSLKWLVNLKP